MKTQQGHLAVPSVGWIRVKCKLLLRLQQHMLVAMGQGQGEGGESGVLWI